MSRNTYKGIDKTIVQQVHFYARKLKSKKCFASEHLEDLEQELMLEVFSVMDRFNESRGCLLTFISSVLNRKSRNMTKKKMQKKRGKGCVFLSLSENDIQDARISLEAIDVHVDLEKVISRLPEKFKTLCETLKYNSASDTSLILGKSKTYVYGRMKVLELLLRRFRCYLEEGGSQHGLKELITTKTDDFDEGE